MIKENNIKYKRPEPWLMLITVKAVIVNNVGEVLLLKRAKGEKTHAGEYDLPGGSMEKGEVIKDALKREIKEETGLKIDNGEIIKISEYPKGHERVDDLKALRFVVSYDDENYKKIKLNKYEHDSFEWLPIDKAIKKLSKKGFEGEKRETLIEAKKYLEMKEGLNNWKRCLAEFDNYRKRQEDARKDTVKYATENIVMQILPVIDNFESSVAHIPEEEKNGGWVQGIMYIKKQLEDVLRENGVEEIIVKVGDNFDTETCEAVDDSNCSNCKTKKKFENKIKKIVLRGYKIGDKIIRPARVVVE
ncbi:MAG TPA: nucleotide exchange factor GrpE [Candidatus Moranbacteria bacterium]|nr:nucleotide exchange factor GrpE [Candidatus Moranbacteria bacterium]